MVAPLVSPVAVASPAAPADSTVSPWTLAGTLVREADVVPWFPKAKTTRAPAPNTGDERVSAVPICFKSAKRVLKVKMPSRQAESEFRLSASGRRNMDSLIGQYKTKAKAKKRMKAVRAKAASCASIIVDAGGTIRQSSRDIGNLYGSRGAGVYSAYEVDGSWDIIGYMTFRRVGRSLVVTSFAQGKKWPGGPPTSVPVQARSAVDALSALVGERYHAIS